MAKQRLKAIASALPALYATLELSRIPKRQPLVLYAITLTSLTLCAVVIAGYFAYMPAYFSWAESVSFGRASQESRVNRLAIGGFLFLVALATTPLWFFALVQVSLSNLAKSFISQYPELALLTERTPVVYIRRFDNENPEVTGGRELTMNNVVEAAMDVVAFAAQAAAGKDPGDLTSLQESRLENVFAATLEPSIGPLIALADPKRSRPLGQVKRLEVKSERWRDAVKLLFEETTLVVAHYESGGSLAWEIEYALSISRPVLLWSASIASFGSSREIPYNFTPMLEEIVAAERERNQDSVRDSGIVALLRPDLPVRYKTVLNYSAEAITEAIEDVLTHYTPNSLRTFNRPSVAQPWLRALEVLVSLQTVMLAVSQLAIVLTIGLALWRIFSPMFATVFGQ